MTAAPLVVFSHLRWDFVYQRPQHLMTRLAANQPILFIEEPIGVPDGAPRWQLGQPAPGVTVCQLHTPVLDGGFADAHLPLMVPQIQQLLADHGVERPTVWFYTPQALPFAAGIQVGAVVYDCMDELAAFDFAPPELIEREAELLARADLVFTGGPSLYRAKADRHPHVYCFPSSVDRAHFARAIDRSAEAVDQYDLPRPRLGFYGVLDERLDMLLLRAVAEARPDWQIVLVGPVVKIDPATIPDLPNVHALGMRGYAQLPDYLAGWDVCLLPFARNAATRYISPTKTLEYMAAERPIVSTPITDVAEPYGEIVYLAASASEFVVAVERALSAPHSEREARVTEMRRVLAQTSWDATAEAMQRLIAAARG